MILESDPAWPSIVLAVILLGDIALSLKPAAFIATCFRGVGLDERWWWLPSYVKALAVIGLLVGLAVPGVGPAVMAGVIAYFIAATIAHIRARFLGSEFWLNCLGMLIISIAALAATLLLGTNSLLN